MRVVAIVLFATPACVAAHAAKLAPVGWERTVAIAPASGPTGLAALAALGAAAAQNDNLRVRAICSDREEERRVRFAACGARLCEGLAADRCAVNFPSLRTFVPASLCWSHDDLLSALSGCTTLLVLLDDVHPVLRSVARGEEVVTLPRDSRMEDCLDRNTRLIDAAAAAGVQHVILHSVLGAAPESRSTLTAERMGGCEHLSLRRDLEQHLERYSSSEAMQSDEYSSAMLRHTILRAAPYATAKQLRERRLRSLLPDEQGGAQPMPPLTSPEQLARAAVQDALYTRPNTLKRRVTREVMCPL